MRSLAWAALMQAGLHRLGLKPWEFWALTPAELAMMLGQTAGQVPMRRQELDALMSAFPDEEQGFE